MHLQQYAHVEFCEVSIRFVSIWNLKRFYYIT
jgi:hypothetical protein